MRYLHQLKERLKQLFSREPGGPGSGPDSQVRQPVKKSPPSRSGAVALKEPPA